MSNGSASPRIFVITRSVAFGDSARGGMERAVGTHCLALRSLGWKISVVTPLAQLSGIQDVPPDIEIIDVPWPKYGRTGRFGFGIAYRIWVRKLAKTLHRHMLSPDDILYLHGGCAGVLRDQKIRNSHVTFANPHGMEEFAHASVFRWTNRVFHRRLTSSARYADRVIATDQSLIEPVRRHIKCNLAQVILIRNGVNYEQLCKVGQNAVNSTCINADNSCAGTRIVTVGRLARNKGYDLLAEALCSLKDNGLLPDEFSWDHFGNGPEKKEVVSILSQKHLLGSWKLHSNADDNEMYNAVANASVFVQPSRYEGSSLTTLEAMAIGTPVVGTPVGGIPDKVRDGVTGYLATEVSSDAIAHALLRALSEDSSAIVQNAHAMVARDFDLQRNITRLSDTMHDMLNGRQRKHAIHR